MRDAARSLELVTLSEGSLDRSVRDAKVALADADLDTIKEVHDRAVAVEAYAKAKERRAEYMAAGEIKLWAERSAGAVRRELPRRHGIEPRFDREEAKRLREQGLTQREVGRRLGVHGSAIGYAERNGWGDGIKGVPLKEFDEDLGVTPSVAYDWERIAEIPEERFSRLVEEAKERDASLTAKGIIRRDGRAYETRVEAGIYRLRDGRLSLRWQKDGVRRMKVLKTDDVAQARKALAKVTGKIKEPPRVRVGNTVGDGYALVRRALQVLDNLDSAEFDQDAKRAVSNALGHLHKAEDELVIASRLTGRKRRAA